ncbi:12650_t:CDS:2 [Acaulospora morrowiae]|uniref:12650_t:CDS:1 n=1 Tax=Acaulospora morrowiae TaxID=94023 RepID=A0A9N9B447_9GLOM|nr:12650_t:CDS:2 [Acaulospora morrowiae]
MLSTPDRKTKLPTLATQKGYQKNIASEKKKFLKKDLNVKTTCYEYTQTASKDGYRNDNDCPEDKCRYNCDHDYASPTMIIPLPTNEAASSRFYKNELKQIRS